MSSTLGAIAVVAACHSASEPRPTPVYEPPSPNALSVLVFTRTEGYRHPSVDDAKRFLTALDVREQLQCTVTEDTTLFTDEGLANFDVVVFANTTGDVLEPPEEAALERFLRSGKGFVGVHAAADTEHDWPFYRELLGAHFVNHPEVPLEVQVTVERGDHPSTTHLDPTFRFNDEWYNFDRNPRETATVLLTIDERDFTVPNVPPGPSMGADHPVAWYRDANNTRLFYTNLGHRPETWQDPAFQRHLIEGIRWAARGGSFSRSILSHDLKAPLGLAVTSRGDIYVIERTGELKMYRRSTGEVLTALTLEVDPTQENGLLGVALDPEFDEQPYVYLYYSEPIGHDAPDIAPGRNVLARFQALPSGELDPNSRQELLAVPSERRCCHEGGALAFASDGTLFVSTGDNTNPFASRGTSPIDGRPGRALFDARRTSANPFDLRGKILRIARDGSIPEGNLFADRPDQGLPQIYAMGVRNPFRIAADPSSPRLFFGDVGPDAEIDTRLGPRGYDELNVATSPGDYGWPYCIGDNRPYVSYNFATGRLGRSFKCSGRRAPALAYDYTSAIYPALGTGLDAEGNFVGRTAIAGAVYRAAPGAPYALPERFSGALVFADWTRDRLALVDVDAAGRLRAVTRLLASEQFKRPIDAEVGADGAIYVLEYGSGFWGDNEDARLSRIEFADPAQQSPSAAITASALHGSSPLRVQFSASGSRAPEGQRIREHEWSVDGVAVHSARGPEFEYVFESVGAHRVGLTVVASSGKRSLPVTETVVVGNSPPRVQIISPTPGFRVVRGSPVELIGEGLDAEDGPAPCDALSWSILLGHNAHTHPIQTLSGCETSFVPDPGDHANESGLQFYAIELTYTDRGGHAGEPPLTAREGVRLEIAHP